MPIKNSTGRKKIVKLNDCDLTRSTNTKRLTNETKKVSQLEINVATLSHTCVMVVDHVVMKKINHTPV